MSSKIKEVFSNIKAQKRKALITYIVSGDPDIQTTLNIMHRMVEEGADIIELGIPFSDPMAEGVSIQRGHERALEKGASLHDAFELVKEFRLTNKLTPIVFMGYMNTFESLGADLFMQNASSSKLDGILIVDMPPEESSEFSLAAKKAFLAARLNSELSSGGMSTIRIPSNFDDDAFCIKRSAPRDSKVFIYPIKTMGVSLLVSLNSFTNSNASCKEAPFSKALS